MAPCLAACRQLGEGGKTKLGEGEKAKLGEGEGAKLGEVRQSCSHSSLALLRNTS